MGITKNKQSNEKIAVMAKAAFPDKVVGNIVELTEGMCNAAYFVTFEDGFQTVLKVASSDRSGFMTNEANLMAAEVEAMRLVKEKSRIKVADVFFYDTSKRLCDGDYFFMEALDGQSFISVMDSLEDDTIAKLRFDVGVLQRKLSDINGEKFGLLGDGKSRFDNLFDFIYSLIFNVLTDAEKRDVVIGVPKEKILNRLQEDKNVFDVVKTPSLVHWDMWEGNIFVKNNEIAGVIDWERAMWGEPFMDDRFRHHNRHGDFLRGFGKEQFSATERKRIYWYDILLYLTMMTEVTYREYEDNGQYLWVKPLFDEVWGYLL